MQQGCASSPLICQVQTNSAGSDRETKHMLLCRTHISRASSMKTRSHLQQTQLPAQKSSLTSTSASLRSQVRLMQPKQHRSLQKGLPRLNSLSLQRIRMMQATKCHQQTCLQSQSLRTPRNRYIYRYVWLHGPSLLWLTLTGKDAFGYGCVQQGVQLTCETWTHCEV